MEYNTANQPAMATKREEREVTVNSKIKYKSKNNPPPSATSQLLTHADLHSLDIAYS